MNRLLASMTRQIEDGCLLSRLGEASLMPSIFDSESSLDSAISYIQDRLLDPVPRTRLDIALHNARTDGLRRIRNTSSLLVRYLSFINVRRHQAKNFENLIAKSIRASSASWALDQQSRAVVEEHLIEVVSMFAVLTYAEAFSHHSVAARVGELTLAGYLVTEVKTETPSLKLIGY